MLTILNVAYPFAPVGIDAVGGAEQVLSMLDRALVQAGHKSLVIAQEDSHPSGELIAVRRTDSMLDDVDRSEIYRHVSELIAETLRRWRIDLVHMHGLDFSSYLPPAHMSTLITLHLPVKVNSTALSLRNIHFNFVSQSQRIMASTLSGTVIENGVPLDVLKASVPKENFVLALGRICPEKGFHHALEAARLADVPMLLAGQLFSYDWHHRYFGEQIEPRLDARRRFIGPLTAVRKARILAAAQCLLVSSTVAETSSLVAMEAMASGTPVVAFPSGALIEIVEHGTTGFIVRSVTEMAAAIRACCSIDPDVCRKRASERFSAERMTGQYLELYGRIVGGTDARRFAA